MFNLSKTYTSLSTQAAYVFIGKLISFLLQFIIPIVLVRVFTKEYYGIYQQMLFVSLFLIETAKWGLINSLYYFYPHEKDKRAQLLSQTVYLLVIIGLFLLPVLYILRYPLSDLFNSPVIATLSFPICLYLSYILLYISYMCSISFLICS